MGGRYRCSTQVHKTKAIRRLRVDCKIDSKNALIISYSKSTGTSIHPNASKIDELQEGRRLGEALRQDLGSVSMTMARGDEVQEDSGEGTCTQFLSPKTPITLDGYSIATNIPAGGMAVAPASMKASTSRSLSHMVNPSHPTSPGRSSSDTEQPYILAQENKRRSMAHLLNPQGPTQSDLQTGSSGPSSLPSPDVRNVDEEQVTTPALGNEGVPHSLRHLLNPSPEVSFAFYTSRDGS
jgi:hypothetical protein